MQLVKKTKQKRSPHLCIRAPGVGGLKLIFKAPKCFAVYLIFFSFFYIIFSKLAAITNFDGYTEDGLHDEQVVCTKLVCCSLSCQL